MTIHPAVLLLALGFCWQTIAAVAGDRDACPPLHAEAYVQLAQIETPGVASMSRNEIRLRPGYAFRKVVRGNRTMTVIVATNSSEVPGTVTCKCDGSEGTCTLNVGPLIGFCSGDCACRISLSAMPPPPGTP